MSNPTPAKDKIASLWQSLEVIDDPEPRAAAFNMAADECLLAGLGEVAVLRIYRWLRPAVSLGYFTALADLRPDWLRERDLVRRWTGGGIVEHGADFTYSLLVPRGGLNALGKPAASYGIIHDALARALAGIGVNATRGSENVRGANCFDSPVADDLIVAGRKGAGAAQRRTRQGILHQGSVQGLAAAPPDWRERLAACLPREFCASPSPRSLSVAEEACARQLAPAKYATETWLRRR